MGQEGSAGSQINGFLQGKKSKIPQKFQRWDSGIKPFLNLVGLFLVLLVCFLGFLKYYLFFFFVCFGDFLGVSFWFFFFFCGAGGGYSLWEQRVLCAKECHKKLGIQKFRDPPK